MLKAESFWARANEESFASQDLFHEIEKTFATGRGLFREHSDTPYNTPLLILLPLSPSPSLSLSLSLSSLHLFSLARGGFEVEQKPRFTAPKIKELKVLDGKTAQNICNIRNFLPLLTNRTCCLVLTVSNEIESLPSNFNPETSTFKLLTLKPLLYNFNPETTAFKL